MLNSNKSNSIEHDIVDRIYEAVLERKLPPGTKLNEAVLCKTFGAGRMRIRKALLLLSSQGLVDLEANRGAFIAAPSKEESLAVYQARLALEPSVARLATDHLNSTWQNKAEGLLEREKQARKSDDRRLAIRLSGEFHVLLAKMTGNPILTRMVKELVTRSSLIIGLYGNFEEPLCSDDEHSEILQAIISGDGEQASVFISDHLKHIQNDLNLDKEMPDKLDISAILGSSLT